MRQQPWRNSMRGVASRSAERGRDREGAGHREAPRRTPAQLARAAGAPSVSAALVMLMVLTGTVGVPTAAAAAESGVSVDTFDDAAPRVSTITGSATPSRSTDATEGEAALAVAYDVTDGMSEVAYPAASAPSIPPSTTALTLDMKGDGTYNTVYLRVRDASGETFVYRVDAMRDSVFQTLTVDLTGTPVAREGGNADGVLDTPLTVAGMLVVRNGAQPPTGTFVIDDLRAVTTGWGLPVASPSFFDPRAGADAEVSFDAAGPGEWELRLIDEGGRTRTLAGATDGAGTVRTPWDGRDDADQTMTGQVRGVFRHAASANGVVGAALTVGVPTLLTVAEADDDSATSLIEGFESGGDGWSVSTGSASVDRAGVAASGDVRRTQGDDALSIDYDLGQGMVSVVRSAPLDVSDSPVLALKVDMRGDSTYNTVYVRVADATGEAFTYRVDAMRDAVWRTVAVDMTQEPALVEGGNGDRVPDMPLTLAGFFVVRNGEQPATGSLLLDNLRVVRSGWSMPQSDVDFLTPESGETATLDFDAASAGNWLIELRDQEGRERRIPGRADEPGDVTVAWDGKAGEGVEMEGPIRSTLQHDSSPDAEWSATPARAGTPTLLTVAAAPTATAQTSEDFEAAASTWRVAMGTASISRVSSPKTQGAFAQRIDYDVSSGLVETVRNTPATVVAQPATGLRVDMRGDGSYNTVYVRVRDAAEEVFTYRLDAMRTTAWTTIDVDLTAPAALIEGGNGDKVLDLPVQLSGFIVVRNGNQPATGSVVLDNVRTLSTGWTLPQAATSFYTPTSPATSLSFSAAGRGNWSILLTDQEGRTKTLTGSAQAAGTVSVAWNGTDDAGTPMRGDVRATFAHDDAAPASTVASTASRSGIPLLLTLAHIDTDATVADGFETAGEEWISASGTVTPSTSTRATQGSGALGIAYDVSSADAEIETTTTPEALLTSPASALKADLLGDGSWNTVYLKLRDATGEMFFYRVGAMGLSRWTTATIDLGEPAATTHLGNDDGILDYPVALVRVIVVRNGSAAPATGTAVLDNLRVIDQNWTLPTSSTARFSRANAGSTTVSFTAGAPGDYALTLHDNSGRTRTVAGTAAASGEVKVTWDGTDDAGVGMTGSVSGRLAWDTTPDGTLTSTVQAAQPYLTGISARPSVASPSSISGINSFLTEQDAPAEADRQAALLEDASVRWAREEFEWKRVEPRKGYYDWAKFDQAVAISRARNVDMIGKLVYSAPWASSAPAGTPAADAQYYPPADNADFAAYAAATVARYKDRVRVWEVWNEPNTEYYWRGGATAQQYGALLKATYDAIKAVDPTATVLVGGLDQFSDPFMQGVHAAGAGNSYDALAIHVYTVDGAPEIGAIPTYLDAAQAFLNRNAPGRGLWITEVSWSTCTTCPGATSEADQASYLKRIYLDAAARGIRGIAWYNLVGGNDPESFLDTYAVTEKSGRLKPAYTALKEVGAVLADGAAVGRAGVSATSTPTRVDDMASANGYAASGINGGTATLRTTSTVYAGSGALQLSYDFSGSSRGAQIQTDKTISGQPTAVSVWVSGDNSASPVYLKIKDATGETFQGLVGNAVGSAWTKMTLFSDGLNANYTRSGGDGDGVWDYPIKVTDIFVYKSTSGVSSGNISFDDLTVDSGVNLHGTVLQTSAGTVQALYTNKAASVSVPVSGGSAAIWTQNGLAPVPVANGRASVALTSAPTFLTSSPAVTPTTTTRGSTVTVDWVSGEASVTTVNVVNSSGAVVRTLASGKRFGAGAQTLQWNGRTSSNAIAPAGAYTVRLTFTTADGRARIANLPLTLT
ncbi:flagellar hook assembly protein FlgD [Microbacterium proteolyticum]|uniref:Flagellar hook assembly protein FlgD n=1 Tax=Microbacterium proteolyticum TaxID=1572644 RepID=A0A7W5GFA6_9MICO|nr:FlgD immunoglobulin-like domain containing protein [Microbacterium proteolyticum]MBB3157388.1 flagellar hook assembly protein FlgD [Microbacterium proteolyticum]